MTENAEAGGVGVTHLWEASHPYYCQDGNYCMNGAHHEYKSWAEFIDDNGDADPDYNLVYRFDWLEGEDAGAMSFNGDVNYRNGVLKVYWMGQRKACARSSAVEVCRADEPAVIEFLRPRLNHLLKLWTPLLPSSVTPTAPAQESAERATDSEPSDTARISAPAKGDNPT
jgi:hypothetical protein